MNAAEILVQTGLEQLRAGHGAEARASFEQALTLQPDHAGAFNLLGVVAQSKGEIDQAVACFERAVSLVSDWPGAWYNLANALRDQGNLVAAQSAYRRAIELQPGFADAMNNLGLVLAQTGAYDEAIRVFRTAMAAAPDNSDIVNNLSALFMRLGRSTEAAILLARATPDDAVAHNNRCLLLRSAGHLSEAAAEAHQAIALNPSFVEAYNNLGLVLMDGRDLIGSAEAFEKALSIRSDFVDALSNLGVVRRLQGELDEALAAYDRLLAQHPGDAKAYSQRGLVLLEMNRFDDALNSLERGIALAPKSPEGYVNMARLMTIQGRLDTAVTLARKALGLDPDHSGARHEHAVVSVMAFLSSALREPPVDPIPDPRPVGAGVLALDGLFNPTECEAIQMVSTGLPAPHAQRPLVPPPPDLAALPFLPETEWIFRRIAGLVRQLNEDIYHFELQWGEPFRLIQWQEGGRGESWRQDAPLVADRPFARKLSLIIQLNDQRDYEGGAFEVWDEARPITAPRQQGCALVFPASSLHRLAPVTRGARRAMLCYFDGPRFR